MVTWGTWEFPASNPQQYGLEHLTFGIWNGSWNCGLEHLGYDQGYLSVFNVQLVFEDNQFWGNTYKKHQETRRNTKKHQETSRNIKKHQEHQETSRNHDSKSLEVPISCPYNKKWPHEVSEVTHISLGPFGKCDLSAGVAQMVYDPDILRLVLKTLGMFINEFQLPQWNFKSLKAPRTVRISAWCSNKWVPSGNLT